MKKTILKIMANTMYFSAKESANKCIFWAYQEKLPEKVLEMRNISKKNDKKI